MNDTKPIEKRFFIAAFMKHGKPALLIRRAICDEKDISIILKEIFTNKEIKILATIKFRDPLTARIRLKKLGLINNSQSPAVRS